MHEQNVLGVAISRSERHSLAGAMYGESHNERACVYFNTRTPQAQRLHACGESDVRQCAEPLSPSHDPTMGYVNHMKLS